MRATELEWRLVPLMRIPATNRTAQLAALSDEDRKMIATRLLEKKSLTMDEVAAMVADHKTRKIGLA